VRELARCTCNVSVHGRCVDAEHVGDLALRHPLGDQPGDRIAEKLAASDTFCGRRLVRDRRER
jgi:hypothetical protein